MRVRIAEHLHRWGRVGARLASVQPALALVFAAAIVSACSGSGNSQLANGGLGISLDVASGNKQSALPQQIFKAPISVKVLDPSNGSGVPDTPVTFTLVGATDAQIQTPTGQTDSTGVVSTFVKAQSAYGTSVTIQATITGTSTSTTFTLSTTQKGAASTYALDSTHHLTETAGVPFEFIVEVLDDSGEISASFNQTVNLYWAIQSNKSWGGSQGTFPGAGSVAGSQTPYTCSFVNGVCDVPGNELVDASQQTLVSVGDDNSTGLAPVYLQPVTVLAGTASQLLIANLAGGRDARDAPGLLLEPAARAVRGVDPPMTFFAAIVDPVGNYISDAPSTTTWSSTPVAMSPGPGNYPNPLTASGRAHDARDVDHLLRRSRPASRISYRRTARPAPGARAPPRRGSDRRQSGPPTQFAVTTAARRRRSPRRTLHPERPRRGRQGQRGRPDLRYGLGRIHRQLRGDLRAVQRHQHDDVGGRHNGCDRFIDAGAGNQYDDGTHCGTYTTPSSVPQTFVAGVGISRSQTLLNAAGDAPMITVSPAAGNGFPRI